jgi:hypothetical protein
LCATTAQAAYSRFARVSLAALDNEQVSIPRDPEVEADIVNSDPAAHEAVRKELHRVCNEMAKAYRDESTKDGSFHDRMDASTKSNSNLSPGTVCKGAKLL